MNQWHQSVNIVKSVNIISSGLHNSKPSEYAKLACFALWCLWLIALILIRHESSSGISDDPKKIVTVLRAINMISRDLEYWKTQKYPGLHPWPPFWGITPPNPQLIYSFASLSRCRVALPINLWAKFCSGNSCNYLSHACLIPRLLRAVFGRNFLVQHQHRSRITVHSWETVLLRQRL